ncbi:MAG: YciK family oxidoreductase [Candidatus Muproteobacteria bacterium RBG_16_64_10]|uniref:YciK family oxidoreductase n=1 Tax=Candidatus Muproteobacteria bacterium RBG_16_64_10 TaxID=1817757 RepID=A0A1F6SYE3_9PROT|nr:MAG: YciK family oxidoreductase [Candidatus Muproteobacteria bacterium RBG_16_64_10]
MPDYTPSPDLLRGRVILITGAGGGIGRAIALAGARHGAQVVLHDRNVKPLEKVYDEIVAGGGPQPAMLPLDLLRATPDACATLAETVQREFSRLDGLVHCAAELGALAPLELYEPTMWLQVLQVNLTAAWLVTRACLPLLKQSPDASIVFTSADVGRQGRAYWGAYGVAAFGLEGLMQVFAQELAAWPNLRVNSIDPGPVRTTMRAKAYPGEDPKIHPLPEDIVASYLYLLGPDSRGQTGRAWQAQRGNSAPLATV